jgi:hypothetical protein
MGSKIAHGCAQNKMQTMASAFTSSEQYYKDGGKFFNHDLQVTDDETWVQFMNLKPKSNHSPNNPQKNKQLLFECHKSNSNCFLGQERSAYGRIHATLGQNNITSVLPKY